VTSSSPPQWQNVPLVVVLDTTPLGLLTQRPGIAEADACKQWLAALLAKGARALVPEIADYEVRRELLRANKAAGLARLDAFNAAEPDRYVPLTTPVFRLAAQLWAQARQQGVPTADVQALDGDVILSAQVLSLALPPGQLAVVTSNPGHLSRFVPAKVWRNITL
jgi:predicted nucleic acid-binding protein